MTRSEEEIQNPNQKEQVNAIFLNETRTTRSTHCGVNHNNATTGNKKGLESKQNKRTNEQTNVMKISAYLSILFCGIASARRSVPVSSKNVHRMGWGVDDDVFLSEPQDVLTFRSESRTIKEIKPVNQVIKKATSKPEESKVRTVKPWCLPRVDDFQDFIGLE